MLGLWLFGCAKLLSRPRQCMLLLNFFWCVLRFVFFFFQAEDGIRDVAVTGVQTCALPISPPPTPQAGPAEEPDREHPLLLTTGRVAEHWHTLTRTGKSATLRAAAPEPVLERSEERRVGKEGRSRRCASS